MTVCLLVCRQLKQYVCSLVKRKYYGKFKEALKEDMLGNLTVCQVKQITENKKQYNKILIWGYVYPTYKLI